MSGWSGHRREFISTEIVSTAKGRDVSVARILRLFKPHWLPFSLILALSLVGTVISLIPPLVMKEIIDQAIPQHNRTLLFVMVGLMVALPLLSGLLGVWQNQLNNRVGQSIMRDLRLGVFTNLQRQSISFFTQSRVGEIIQRLTGDIQMVQNVVTNTVISGITQLTVVVITIIILFTLGWKLALLSVIVLPLFILPVRKVSLIRKKLRTETQKVRGDMSSQIGEIFGVSGALLTRIFGKEKFQEQQFTQMNQKVMDLELKLNIVGRWFGMGMGVLGPLGTALIFLYGGLNVLEGKMSIGGIVAFSAYVGRLYGPLSQLLNLQVETVTALGVFKRVFDYQDMIPEIIDADNASSLKPVKGDVRFNHVTFAYGDQAVLKDITFHAEPGQIVAIVGPSGAGKSTLLGMLSRLYDPIEGGIELDGTDIKSVTLTSLRAQMAVVTQETFLFHATIRENLLFGKDDASESELEQACKQAYIYDFICSLPDGFDTFVGERGHRLSGGERQRLSIARAILKNPRILILDEATSNLDSESEAVVQAALEQLMRDRTTLVIAHRLSTILAADRIIVMDNGQIVEEGTHEQLISLDGIYAKLFHTQFAKVLSQDSFIPPRSDDLSRGRL